MRAPLDTASELRSSNRAAAEDLGLFDGARGGVYAACIERERLARLVARSLWGSDLRPFYRSMSAIGRVPPGGVVLDAPCGGGVAFRGIGRAQRIRYQGIDLSTSMLERARWRAEARGIRGIELRQGDLHDLPVQTASADLVLSYFGLHCVGDPARAVAELVRCLRPGGRLVGSTIALGGSWRQRLLARANRGVFGPGGELEDARAWLESTGLEICELEVCGAFVYFHALKPETH